jgi:hypothetical protein
MLSRRIHIDELRQVVPCPPDSAEMLASGAKETLTFRDGRIVDRAWVGDGGARIQRRPDGSYECRPSATGEVFVSGRKPIWSCLALPEPAPKPALPRWRARVLAALAWLTASLAGALCERLHVFGSTDFDLAAIVWE